MNIFNVQLGYSFCTYVDTYVLTGIDLNGRINVYFQSTIFY